MEKEAAFRYEPLSHGHIRLLNIHPSADTDAHISCSLATINVRGRLHVSYEALSYTWGDERPSASISLNETSFLCRPNLLEALRRLRRADEPLPLWVDAICINQDDTIERNHQVSLMKTIYSRAKVVDVWLGDSTPGSEQGMMFLRTMHETLSAVHINTRPMRVGSTWARGGQHSSLVRASRERNAEEFKSYYEPILKLLRDKEAGWISDLDAAVALLQRPWWTRMWTLQESVLGREVRVFCGDSVAPLQDFFELSYFIFLSLNFRSWSGTDISANVNARAAWSTADLRDHVKHRGLVSPLLALDSTWQRKASDPRDKIFGVMGLVGNAFDFDADYEWSVERVYTAAITAIAKKEKCLTFLGFISEQSDLRNPKLPSWVPDLEMHSTIESDYISSLSKPRFYARLYDASRLGTQKDDTITVDGSILGLKGLVVDQITDVGAQAPGRILTDQEEDLEKWRTDMKVALDHWRSLLPTEQDYTHTKERAGQAFWRCVLADLRQDNVHPLYDPGRPTRLLEHERREIENLDGRINELLSFWASFCKREFRQLRMIEQFNRRFFVTATGYIGLGPPSLRRGDRGDLSLTSFDLQAIDVGDLLGNGKHSSSLDDVVSLIGELQLRTWNHGRGVSRRGRLCLSED
ncbi:hypothetical protein PG989_004380 [Apiospora arundinis]